MEEVEVVMEEGKLFLVYVFSFISRFTRTVRSCNSSELLLLQIWVSISVGVYNSFKCLNIACTRGSDGNVFRVPERQKEYYRKFLTNSFSLSDIRDTVTEEVEEEGDMVTKDTGMEEEEEVEEDMGKQLHEIQS